MKNRTIIAFLIGYIVSDKFFNICLSLLASSFWPAELAGGLLILSPVIFMALIGYCFFIEYNSKE